MIYGNSPPLAFLGCAHIVSNFGLKCHMFCCYCTGSNSTVEA